MRYIQYIFNNPYIIKNSSLNFKDLMSCLNYIAAKLNIFIIQKEELDEERNQKLYELGNNLKRNF